MHKIIMLLVVALNMVCLSSCYDVLNLNENAYLLAIGIDKGVASKYRFTLQFAQPQKSMGEEQEGTTSSSELVTIDAPDLMTAIYSVKEFKSKRINGSHVKIAVFGNEVAKEGIAPLLASFIEPGQLRTNLYLAVAAEEASAYLKGVTPQTEIFITKFYERQFSPDHGINLAAPRLYDTFFAILEKKRDVVLPLVGINTGETLMQKTKTVGNAYLPGDIPRESVNISEMAGAAVFKGDKLVDVMNQEEANAYYMLHGVYAFGYITIPDPIQSENVLVFHMEQRRNPLVKFNINTGDIYIKLFLSGVIFYQEGDYDYDENIELLESFLTENISKRCAALLQKNMKASIDLLGIKKYADAQFMTISERRAYYVDVEKLNISVSTDVDIKRTGNLTGVKK